MRKKAAIRTSSRMHFSTNRRLAGIEEENYRASASVPPRAKGGETAEVRLVRSGKTNYTEGTRKEKPERLMPNDILNPQPVVIFEEDALLELYLSLTTSQRGQRFGDTARVAELTGVTRRTVQLWVQAGDVRAIPIAGKYQIDMDSVKSYLKLRAGTWMER